MKTILKMIGGLVIGGLVGLLIGGVLAGLFTGKTFAEYFHGFQSIQLSEGVGIFLVAIGSLVLSLAVLIPIHELGHLVCGLLTGYKFVSFRIFNLTFLKENGKIRIKKYGIQGTGGQCLLTPPDLPLEEIPTGWYNLGGILANLVVLILVLPFFLLDLNPFVAEALGVFALTDLVIILLNGIPMQAGGVGNDGYNMSLLKKNLCSKQGLMNQLRANALIQNGVRPKDMPDELFANPRDIDYKNALEVAIPLSYASRLIDQMRYDEATAEMEYLYSHKDEIMPLYVKEIACELAYLYLRTGRNEEAEKLLDKDLRRYIDAYSKVMSSKLRLQVAIALCLDRDEPKARQLYDRFAARQTEYLLRGEALSDLALLEDLFANYNKSNASA